MSIGGIQVSGATLSALQNLPQAGQDLEQLMSQREELGTKLDQFNRGDKESPLPGDQRQSWNESGQRLFSATFDFNEATDKMLRNSLALAGSLSPENIKEMNLETLVMYVQMGRANMMEAQLRDQIGGIQGRTEKLGELRDLLNQLKACPKGADGKTQIPKELGDKLKANGIRLDDVAGGGYSLDAAGMESAQNTLNAQIDQNNASQQIDMIKMQQLMSKRNEAYDMLTNFLKKSADEINTVIGNMR